MYKIANAKQKYLSKKEEAEIFKRYHTANKNEKENIKNIFIQQSINYIIRTSGRYARYDENLREDLIMEGIVGALETIEKFDHTKGYKFLTFAWKIIHARIYDFFLKKMNHYVRAKNAEREFDIVKVSSTDELIGEDYSVIDSLESDEDTVNNVDFLMCSKKINTTIYECLNEKEIDFIKLRYGFDNKEPYTYGVIAKIHNISKERVRQIVNKAEIKIFKYIKGNYGEL